MVLRHGTVDTEIEEVFRFNEAYIKQISSEDTQWHKMKRNPIDNVMSHPADGEAWKDFDSAISKHKMQGTSGLA
jgi:hypothetical protein